MVTVARDPSPPVEACLDLARALEEHFTADALAEIRAALDDQRTYVARDGDDVVGFATIDRGVPAAHRRGETRDDAVAELTWIGVRPSRQGDGVGGRLLETAADELADAGVRVLSVKTLAPSVEYRPYEATRRFYEANGFVPVETIDPYPGWEPGNPCSIYVKPLATADERGRPNGVDPT